MVRYLIVAFMAALMIGCNAPEPQEPQEEKPVPEIDLSDYVEGQWRGVQIPEAIFSYDMKAIVDSIVTHEYVKVDDVAFVEKLTSGSFHGAVRFGLNKLKTDWECLNMYVGGPTTNTLYCDSDGKLYLHDDHNWESAPQLFEAIEGYMRGELGHEGWYTTHSWSYDPETNTLTTIVDEELHEARVLVFEEDYAILEGLVGGMPFLRDDIELYLFKFSDFTAKELIEKYISGEKYYLLWSEYCQRMGIENKFLPSYFMNCGY